MIETIERMLGSAPESEELDRLTRAFEEGIFQYAQQDEREPVEFLVI